MLFLSFFFNPWSYINRYFFPIFCTFFLYTSVYGCSSPLWYWHIFMVCYLLPFISIVPVLFFLCVKGFRKDGVNGLWILVCLLPLLLLKIQVTYHSTHSRDLVFVTMIIILIHVLQWLADLGFMYYTMHIPTAEHLALSLWNILLN